MPIKPKVDKWYWIEDPGSNLHRGYTGPAKCLTDEKEFLYCGGPTYEFEFFDKDGGEHREGGMETAGFGEEDIIRECSGPHSTSTGSNDELVKKIEELTARVVRLEKRLKKKRKKNDPK